MVRTLLRRVVRRWSRRITVGVVCATILPVTSLAIEQAAELLVHGHFGHDLPGDEDRHAHQGCGDPSCPCPEPESRDAVALASVAAPASLLPCAALVLPTATGSASTGRERAMPIEPRPAERATGPPRRPPIA